MTDLPIEMWHLIFDHLHLVDLSSCALVCKSVYLMVKAYRIREIAFTGRVHEWFHYTTPTIDHKRRVDFTMVSILKRSSFNFDYLKRLKIGRRSAFDLDVINKFTRLEELDIDLGNYENYEKSRTLSLANLKVLYLFVPDDLSYVELDIPRLTEIYTFNLEKLEFLYPESVRCIHTFFHGGKLSMFRNLEYLTLTDDYNELDYSYFHDSQSFKEYSVTALKKLKEIDFYYTYLQYREKNMSVFKRITANLLALGRPDLKVFWQNVQVTDPNLLTEYERMEESFESDVAFQLQYFEKLKEKNHFFWWYEFNGSMKKLSRAGFNVRSEEFISKFLPRYSFRRILVTGQVEERELLLDLITRSPDLFELEFENSGLGHSFFNRMAVRLNATPLRQLRLEGSLNGVKNFDFLLKLRDLERFETDQQLPNKLIPKLLRLSMLVQIEFRSQGTNRRIELLPRRRFLLNEESLSLNELLEHFGVKPGLVANIADDLEEA